MLDRFYKIYDKFLALIKKNEIYKKYLKAKEQNKETNSEDQLKNIVLKQEEKFSKFLTEFETLSSMNQKALEF